MDLSLINAALVSTGNNPIASEADGSAAWRVAQPNWDLIVHADLEAVAWSFCRKTAILTSRVEGDFGYSDGYNTPGDFLRVRSLRGGTDRGCRISAWDEADDFIYCDNSGGSLWVEYTYDAPPVKWPGLFRAGIKLRFEALFLRALNEEDTEAQNRNREAEARLEQARLVSARRRSKRPAFSSSLVRSRVARGTV